ncbi:MAG: T9SS type A sorting domain-containing protein, partial [Saprospiraceae bacterium]
IPASSFNAASFDNCGDVYFKVKRMTAPSDYSCSNPGNPLNQFDDFIQFCCEDIVNNEIMVILRVYDLPPVPGPVSDSYLAGHFNDCMVQVEVQDKLPPSIICPVDLTISCIFPYTEENLDVFGSIALTEEDREQICLDDPGVPGDPGLQCFGLDGLALDNCNVQITTSAIIDVNMCGVGTITRTFTATDDGGRQSTCEQVISIINYDLFDLSDIVWPADYTTFDICDITLLDPEDLSPPYNEPILSDGPCDLVGANYDDAVFDFSNTDQACFKILRTWTVLDWCQLNSQSGGIWTHIQVIKAMNNVGPVIEPLPDLSECSFDPECEGLEIDFEAVATDDCSGPASLSWRYFIDIDNNQSFDFTSQIVFDDTLRFTRELPIGSHRILYTVSDQCGNITTEEQLVDVVSCKAPSAKCIHGLSTNLMAMDLDGDGIADWGMVTLQASMFDAGSDHPCGNSLTVAFSENPLDVTRVFDCNDLGDNEIELWAIDENGLTDFCITTVDIQDNNNICPPELGGTGTISGNINVPGSGKLAGAMVYLDGSNAEGIPSGSNGYFVFPSMPLGGQYDVRPIRDGDARNGVTTLDLVKIQKHLLGIEFFKNPYQYIAADANNSSSITAVDIIQLRKLILGYYSELPSNHSWRFIDSRHVFPDENNPWLTAWPETYSIHPFSTTMSDVDFDAVKVGDVNLTASTQARSNLILPRNADHCEVEYRAVHDSEEGIIRIEVVLQSASKYNAVQFSFTWDQRNYPMMDWAAGEKITADDIRMPVSYGESGSIAVFSTTGWQDQEIVLFSFRVKESTTQPSNFRLLMSQGPTEAVAYVNETESIHSIKLINKTSEPFPVYNKPNPFKDATTIVFESKISEPAQLKVFDLSGKMILNRQVQLHNGLNEYFIHRSDLPNPGMYSYELKSETQHSTNRMIIVD